MSGSDNLHSSNVTKEGMMAATQIRLRGQKVAFATNEKLLLHAQSTRLHLRLALRRFSEGVQ